MGIGLLGQHLLDLRLGRGWTQIDLAERSGVSQGMISRLENGQGKRPGLPILRKLSNTLQVPLDELAQLLEAPDPALDVEMEARINAEVERRWGDGLKTGQLSPETVLKMKQAIREQVIKELAQERQADPQRRCAEERPPYSAAG